MEIKDISGLGAPITKLIEVLSAGMGRLYEPKAIRKKADAEAYAAGALAIAKRDSALIEAETDAQAQVRKLEILANGDTDLIERARVRVLTREVEGQLNVESIAEHALKELPSNVSKQPVSDDWRRKFFLEAENICDEDLQLLWGKVLAGETSSPGSYSIRTLNVLKNLSKEEAEIFRVFCSLAFSSGIVVRLPGRALDEFGLNYGALLTLRNAGLLHENDNLHRAFEDIPEQVTVHLDSYNGIPIELSSLVLRSVQIPCLPLTQAGKELKNLIAPQPNENYLKAAAIALRAVGLTLKRGKASPVDGHPTAMVISFDEIL